MTCGRNGAGPRPNAFALVSYIPHPLGQFLDDLRRELAPACVPHAHVTILPPRPISADPQTAAAYARGRLQDFAPFNVEATDINVFPVTDVVYLEIGEGAEKLRELHELLNGGPLRFEEPFRYHPHIALAQELVPEEVNPALERASRAWRAMAHPRRFLLDVSTFVRNASLDVWIDLEEFRLGTVPVP